MENHSIANNEGGLTEFTGSLVFARSDALADTKPDYQKTIYLYVTDERKFVVVREKLNRPLGASANKVIEGNSLPLVLDALGSNKLANSFIAGLLKKFSHLNSEGEGDVLELIDVERLIFSRFGR